MRNLVRTKYGLGEDPRGLTVTWTVNGQTYNAKVEGTRWDAGYVRLAVRKTDETLVEVNASAVKVLD